MTFCCH